MAAALPPADAAAAGLVRGARRLRLLCGALELVLGGAVALSVLAMGAVHPWAYVPLWGASLLAGALALLRAREHRALRHAFGPRRLALQAGGRAITLDATSAYGVRSWSFDLGRPLLARGPLFWPGLAFLLWVGAQLALGLTLSRRDTLRGLAFLLSACVLHAAAASALGQREARSRLRRLVAAVCAAAALVALVQAAAGATRVYGLLQPQEGGIPFGPFANRNHFAGYMLMAVPTSLALLARAWRRYRTRLGERPGLRRALVSLSTREGIALVYATVPAMAGTAALIASQSRGGLLAFGAGLVLAGIGLRRREVPAWAVGAAFVAVALSWYGLERLDVRFRQVATDAPGRTVIWREALAGMPGRWWTGSGFNTFSLAVSRVDPWTLPRGATPWPESLLEQVRRGERPGYRTPPELAGTTWFREAHNDYVQVLVEAGLPGLLLALLAALAALRAAAPDPWRLAAVAGVLMHELVDFDLQIPAVATLFVVLAGMNRSTGFDSPGRHARL